MFEALNDAAAEPGMSRAAMLGTLQGVSENLQETSAAIDDIEQSVESIDSTIEDIERSVSEVKATLADVERRVESLEEGGKASRGIAIATLVVAALTLAAAIGPDIVRGIRFLIGFVFP